MKSETRIPRLLLVLAATVAAPHAAAGDACLAGDWSPVGNGAAEWMQRQVPGMKMAVTEQVATLHLGGDGSYSLGAQLRAEAGQQGRSARSDGTFSAQGRWTSADGRLTLVPTASDTEGRVEMRAGDGRSTGFALPRSTAQTTVHEYACSGDTLETRMPIPGSAHPIVQRYQRR
ncbi:MULTISPECIES: hypothetical protein [unclassified Luteimonas]